MIVASDRENSKSARSMMCTIHDSLKLLVNLKLELFCIGLLLIMRRIKLISSQSSMICSVVWVSSTLLRRRKWASGWKGLTLCCECTSTSTVYPQNLSSGKETDPTPFNPHSYLIIAVIYRSVHLASSLLIILPVYEETSNEVFFCSVFFSFHCKSRSIGVFCFVEATKWQHRKL